MSEEVTYADLKFPGSLKTENIEAFENFEIKETPVTSDVSHHRVLALTVLCSLLLIGLGILGSMFYVTSKKQMEKLDELQNVNEELQGNLSQLLMDNMNNSMKINNLSHTLQEITTKFCHELYRKNKDHKCKPCPEKWLWHENSCYLLTTTMKSWQESKMECSSQNASLLKINNKSISNYIKSKKLYNFWLGLSPRYSSMSDKNLDSLIDSPDWNINKTNKSNDKLYCGYLYGYNVYYSHCKTEIYSICMQLAGPVKIANTLSEVPDERA